MSTLINKTRYSISIYARTDLSALHLTLTWKWWYALPMELVAFSEQFPASSLLTLRISSLPLFGVKLLDCWPPLYSVQVMEVGLATALISKVLDSFSIISIRAIDGSNTGPTEKDFPIKTQNIPLYIPQNAFHSKFIHHLFMCGHILCKYKRLYTEF